MALLVRPRLAVVALDHGAVLAFAHVALVRVDVIRVFAFVGEEVFFIRVEEPFPDVRVRVHDVVVVHLAVHFRE